MTDDPPPTAAPPPSLTHRLLGGLGALLVRLLALTLRIRINDRAGLAGRAPDAAVMWIFWHNRILIVPSFWRLYCHRRKGGSAMTSTSKDGEWIAQLVSRFGIRPIRGSTSRRSLGAIKEISSILRRGEDVAITPDGSRGPKYELKPGVLIAARLGRAPIVPMGVEYSRFWQLKSWDSFRIPKPFSAVEITLGPLVEVAATATEEEFEVERQRVERALLAVTNTL